MKEDEAESVMSTIADLNTDISVAKKVVAQGVYDFLQMNLSARPDRELATMKFTAWKRLRKMLLDYGAK